MELKRVAFVIMFAVIACAPQGSGVAAPATLTATPAPTPSPTPRAVLEVPPERTSLRTSTVRPSEIDAAVPATAAPHYVAFDPVATARGQLFVFMGGNAVLPADTALIVRQAASNGFHAISLDYARDVRVPTLCEKATDEGCYEKVRLETIDGTDRTPLIAVPKANSIIDRLTKLLSHLATANPSDGWSAYLKDGEPLWSKVRLGGQSEGGTHATVLARDREVARLCVLEAPVDLITSATGERRLAPWIRVGSTPAERIYAFRHIRSSSPLAPAFPLAFAALGLDRFGPAVDADPVSPPFEMSHHLTTAAAPIDDKQANLSHRSVVQDRVTPKAADGRPLFAPVWQYLCFS